MRARGISPAALLAVALAALIACPPQAFAQRDANKKAASAHFQQGSQLYAADRFDEALVEFQAGYAAFPLPGFLVNIGQCYRKLDRLAEAADVFKQFLDATGPENRLRGDVEDAYAEVKGELERRAQAEARRQRDAEEQRQALLRSIASQTTATATAPAPPSIVEASAPAEVRAQPHKRSRWWVWTLVGVAAAGAAASAVALGLTYGQPHDPMPGSLGLLDGRRP